jgi:hypothetical protein
MAVCLRPCPPVRRTRRRPTAGPTQRPQQEIALEMTDSIKTTAAEKTTVIFLHIRKTAGRCLDTEILRREYAPEEHFNIDVQDFKARVATLRSLPEEAKRRIRLVEGHIGFGFHQLLPQQAAYVTLLRDPVDRVLSLYYYTRRSPWEPFHEQAVAQGLEEFIHSDVMRIEVDNFQTRIVSGMNWHIDDDDYADVHRNSSRTAQKCTEDDLLRAKQNIRKHFAVVGFTRHFIESVLLMKRAFGWRRHFYMPRNITRGRKRVEPLPPSVADLIRSYNQHDTALYAFAQELFRERLIAGGDSLQQELKQYRLLNSTVGRFLCLGRYAVEKTLSRIGS